MSNKWTDHNGREWTRITSKRALKFNYPLHAALRAFVFHRDNYCCVRCLASAVYVPPNYDGRFTLNTNTTLRSGHADALIVDHVVTRSAGGTNDPENLQTLCETCNKRKQKEDKAAIAKARA